MDGVEIIARRQEDVIPLGDAMFKAQIQALESKFATEAAKAKATARKNAERYRRQRAADRFDDGPGTGHPTRRRKKNQKRRDRKKRKLAQLRLKAEREEPKPKPTFNGFKNTKCFKCGKVGHVEANCPN